MLQQTRVETVLPYYERFLARFPSVEALALADEQDVLREWSGLGYYARARNLQRAARQVQQRHGGALPRDPAALRALPGVGRYTLGALLSIAFGQRAALVDGNVRRVLSRLFALSDPDPEALWSLAQALVPRARPGDWNQALMELGATVCRTRNPACDRCPLARSCAAHAGGRTQDLPAPARRARRVPVRALAGVLRRRRPEPAVLMLRRPSRGLLGGLWELPAVAGSDPRALVDELAQRTGLLTQAGETVGELRHVFTHRTLDLRVLDLARRGGRLRASPDDARWCTPAQAHELPLSRLSRRTLELAGLDGRES